jgi:hypothetical protein
MASDNSENFPDTLQQTTVNINSQSVCNSMTGISLINAQICAGNYRSPIHDTCQVIIHGYYFAYVIDLSVNFKF